MAVILFDCDGNVVESEIVAMKIACDSLVAVADKQGISVQRAYVDGLFGKTIQNMIDLLSKDFEVKFPSDIRDVIHKETVLALSTQTEPSDGIGDFLEVSSSKGNKHVIATSSEHDRVIAALECAGLKPFFPTEMIFSATTTLNPPQPKPSPAIYNHVMKVLNITPEATSTSEDSTSGTGSAAGADLVCYGNMGGRHVAHIKGAHAEKMLKAGAQTLFNNWREMIDHIPHLTRPKTDAAAKARQEMLFKYKK